MILAKDSGLIRTKNAPHATHINEHPVTSNNRNFWEKEGENQRDKNVCV